MKTLLLSFGLFVAIFSSEGQNLAEIRSAFHLVVLNPDDSKDFHQLVNNVKNPSYTIEAYQAVSEALLAQVVWNPISKLKQVVKYNKMMERIVDEDPTNIEIRFLRLAIEYNLPSFLGMSTHLEEDAAQIVSNLSNVSEMQVNPMFGKYILSFLEQTDLCTPYQLNQVKKRFDQGVITAGVE